MMSVIVKIEERWGDKSLLHTCHITLVASDLDRHERPVETPYGPCPAGPGFC
jgi:hypothetical protein